MPFLMEGGYRMDRLNWWLRLVLAGTLLIGVNSSAALAQQKTIVVAASPELVESGLADFLYPRFSFKHNVRIRPVELGSLEAVEAHIWLGPETTVESGTPVLVQGDTIYNLEIRPREADADSTKSAQKLLDWLISDIGKTTVRDFENGEGLKFLPVEEKATVRIQPVVRTDVSEGLELSLQKCGRCHVVGAVNRMQGIGSTPSFHMLRTLPDWEDRFFVFYVLNPHPAFIQITDVTPPFRERQPPPIEPIELTLEHIDAIVAYVSTLEPARLGQPLANNP